MARRTGTRPRARCAAAVVGGAIAALLAGCGSSSGSGAYRAIPGVDGVRTADDGKAVVVTYVAGPCDKVPATRVTTSSTAVTLAADIPSDCQKGKVSWALKFPLSGTLGTRLVRNGPNGATRTAFDGDVLTDPKTLPTGYRQQSETQGPGVGGGWTRDWIPAAGTAGDELEITQSTALLPAPAGTPEPGHWLVGRLPATVTADTAARTVTVQWDPKAGRSSRVSAVQTGSAPTLTVTELLAVASSLPTRG